MNDEADDLQHLAGEYVLGTLDGAQRRDVERRLPLEPALRAAVDGWEARLLPLTALAGEQQPSPQLWPRIAGSVAAYGAPATADGWGNWWNSLRLWRGLTVAGFTAASVFGLLAARPAPPGVGAPAFMVVLVGPQDKAPGWVVQASLDRRLTLTPLRGDAPPSRKAYQFWTKGADWARPVSLGLVQPGAPVQVALDALPPLQADQLFEITLEPETGSPTGKPTGPILYIGRAVPVGPPTRQH